LAIAAAALQGAPVTTVDFDFFFRKTPANLKKLKRIVGRPGRDGAPVATGKARSAQTHPFL
jgi:hypothetical protein